MLDWKTWFEKLQEFHAIEGLDDVIGFFVRKSSMETLLASPMPPDMPIMPGDNPVLGWHVFQVPEEVNTWWFMGMRGQDAVFVVGDYTDPGVNHGPNNPPPN